MKKALLISVILLIISSLYYSQEVNPNGYNVFYFPDSGVSSEGTMRNGKPDGYWKSYYKNGNLKSEGNRKDFKLDSIWRFYYPNGKIKNLINYRNDLKNGYTYTYLPIKEKDSIVDYYLASKELYLNGTRQGESFYYYSDSLLQYVFYYRNDKKHGPGKEFAKDSTIITLYEYFNGYLIEQQKINRTDSEKRKQGKWITYYDNEQIKIESSYLNNKLHGYYREYNKYGKLIAEKRYLNGEEITREIEEEIEVKADIRTTYWPNGKTKFTGAFLDGNPVGLHKEFDEDGKLELAKIFNEFGNLTAQGLTNNNGQRTGAWTLFYENGNVLAKGEYLNGKKHGNWLFSYQTGELEQKGKFLNDKPEGTWYWYYPDGSLLREENYLDGKRENLFVEYDNNGEIITKGEYFDGDMQGEWFYNVGDHTEIGSYNLGLKNGVWIHYYQNDNKSFEGEYRNGEPIGKHSYFYPNGNLKLSGNYRGGKKVNKWRKYNQDGSIFATYKYRNGALIAIDGKKLEKDDIIEK
jgi:uncharacterized protein